MSQSSAHCPPGGRAEHVPGVVSLA